MQRGKKEADYSRSRTHKTVPNFNNIWLCVAELLMIKKFLAVVQGLQ